MPVMSNFENFKLKVKQASPDRYELWYDHAGNFALMAVVTSQNVHSYGYRAIDSDERDEVMEAAEKLNTYEMEDLNFSRIFRGA